MNINYTQMNIFIKKWKIKCLFGNKRKRDMIHFLINKSNQIGNNLYKKKKDLSNKEKEKL